MYDPEIQKREFKWFNYDAQKTYVVMCLSLVWIKVCELSSGSIFPTLFTFRT